MVRNPRTLLMYGLLGVAGALVLGARLPTGPDAPTSVRAMAPPSATDGAWTRVDAPIAAARPVQALDAGLRESRHPREPRLSREALARASR
ncbi:MAG TPA: hypothetical protein VFE72_02155 [Lysobacter sp.]|nr:hypothetical protein [Lysobacter sp.]